MTDILDQITAMTRCRRCQCRSCGRAGAGELHDHVCTRDADCIDTVPRLRDDITRRNLLCMQAADEIRALQARIEERAAKASGVTG